MSNKSKKFQIKRKRNNSLYIVAIVVVVALASVVGYYFYSANQGSSSVTNTTGLVYAKIDTSMGSIEVQLYPSSAPKTVANFVNLTNSGFYDNLVWHRIVDGFVIQTGDPNTRNGGGTRSTWGAGSSSPTVPLEIDSSLHNDVGYLGVARRQDPNSGSCQFYINLAKNTNLDGQYTVFGKVISGMDVVNAIAKVPVDSNSQPINLVYLTKVTMISSP